MYQRSQQTAWRTIADETVILDLEKKQMYGLNPTGAFVWLTLEAVRDFDQLLGAAARHRDGEGRSASGVWAVAGRRRGWP